MKKTVQIHVKGEYRAKKSKDEALIKSFDTKIILDVDSRNAIKYELKKDKRLYKHIRDTVDEYASSVREVQVISVVSNAAMDAGIDIATLKTCGRDILEEFIRREELRIDPDMYPLLSGLRSAVLRLVDFTERKPVARLVDSLTTGQGDEQREVVRETIEEIEELDDRGQRLDPIIGNALPIEELPFDDVK